MFLGIFEALFGNDSESEQETDTRDTDIIYVDAEPQDDSGSDDTADDGQTGDWDD